MWSTPRSIFRKILNPILVALVLQAVLLYGFIAFGGTLAQLREKTYGIFQEKVDSGRDRLENEMAQRWSNLSETVERVLVETDLLLRESGFSVGEFLSQRQQVEALLHATAPEVLYLLRKNAVSGAFLILDTNDTQEKPALYFTDPDPDSNPSDYSDLQVKYAPVSVSKELGIALSAKWLPALPVKDGNMDFFTKPLQAAWDYTDIGYKDLGYWSQPVCGNDKMDFAKVLAYSVPLVYEGRPFGVLGVEITLDYLSQVLPEVSRGQPAGAYVLAVSAEGRQTYEPVAGSGGTLRQTILRSEELTLVPHSDQADFKELTGPQVHQKLIARVAPLRLYNTHTPFEGDSWAVLGVVRQQDLLQFVGQFRMTLLLTCLLTFALGIALVFMVSKRIAHPIALLSARVKHADPSKPILLPKLQIEEIDELSESIEYLSAEVVNAGAKLSRILAMADISIGFFEYNEKSEGKIFMTSRFFRVLSGSAAADKYSCMSARNFSEAVRRIADQAESVEQEREETAYTMHFSHEGIPYWSRLKIVQDGDRTLGVVTDITQEVLEKRRLEYDRDYDILTNLFNRRAFQTGIRQLMENPETLQISALIMMDLDNLKFINDTYGHDLGDEYIRSAAAALKKASGLQSLVARLSGDEFVVFLYGFTAREAIRGICTDIQSELQRSSVMLPDGTKVQVRASAGLAWYPDDAKTSEELIRYADFAMYMVKRVNKGQFTDFNLETYHRESYLLHGREELNLILEQGLLDYHFQPVFDAKTGAVFGYEALMRPRSETVRSPMELLSLARSQSHLQRVEELTMFLALERFLHLELPEHTRVFLNSIPSQILTPEQIAAFETQFGAHLNRVIFEITEEERSDLEITGYKQELLQRWGSSMALDDYGVGYNGETALLEFAPHFIKLDISIVKNISNDNNRYQLLESLIDYSRQRDIKVIAEGVEHQADMHTLIRAGVDYLQGYYLAKPSAIPMAHYPSSTALIQEANELQP